MSDTENTKQHITLLHTTTTSKLAWNRHSTDAVIVQVSKILCDNYFWCTYSSLSQALSAACIIGMKHHWTAYSLLLEEHCGHWAGTPGWHYAADCFRGSWLKSPLSTEVWHLRHIWRETAFQFAEVLALNGETYVISVNEFLATCNWQSLEYKLNRTGARTEPRVKPLRWGLQELVSLPMCTLKHRSRRSRPTSRVNQYGMLLLSL